MNHPSQQNSKKGLIAGALSYIIWGILPFYWKTLNQVSPLSILCYRIVWSFMFMLLVLIIFRQLKPFWTETLTVLKNKKRVLAIILAALLVSANWFIFIFTVGHGKVIDASLGYYINPLINVILATIFLKERIGRSELIACVLATLGVVLLAVQSGQIPWSSLAMAVTFGLYGLIKKVANVSSLTGLTLETLIMMPLALIYLIFFSPEGFMTFGTSTNLLLMGAGVVTAIPLFLFAESAKNISYILLGFLQYIGPTLMLISAVFLFGESFALPQFLAFGFIWMGILIFTASNLLKFRHQRRLG